MRGYQWAGPGQRVVLHVGTASEWLVANKSAWLQWDRTDVMFLFLFVLWCSWKGHESEGKRAGFFYTSSGLLLSKQIWKAAHTILLLMHVFSTAYWALQHTIRQRLTLQTNMCWWFASVQYVLVVVMGPKCRWTEHPSLLAFVWWRMMWLEASDY